MDACSKVMKQTLCFAVFFITYADVHYAPFVRRSIRYVFHGIHYNQVSKRLYAINHDESIGESIEVFAVSGDAPALRLDHIASVCSELFNTFALNDVVEGAIDENEFYVSEWYAQHSTILMLEPQDLLLWTVRVR